MIVTCINVLKKSDRLKHFIPVWNSRMIMFKGKKCARNVDSQESYFWRFDTGFPGHSGYFLGKIRGQKLAQLLLLGSLMEPFRCPQFHVHWGNIERKSSDVTDSYPFGRKVKLELQVWFRVGWSNKEMSKIFYRYSHITSTPPPPKKKKKKHHEFHPKIGTNLKTENDMSFSNHHFLGGYMLVKFSIVILWGKKQAFVFHGSKDPQALRRNSVCEFLRPSATIHASARRT